MCVCLSLQGHLPMQSMWGPCFRTHHHALSEQLPAGQAAAEVSDVPSSSGEGALPQPGLFEARVGPWTHAFVSSVRTAPAAVLGHVSGADQMPQLLHCKACVVHPCGRQGSPS